MGKHIAFVLDDTVITNPKVNARIVSFQNWRID
ncbi:MAG: hypothetical protein ACLSF1_27955 [Bacteroides thetaiotaomicron]